MQNLRITKARFIGWTRTHDKVALVQKYHLKDFCNTITTFAGRCFAKDKRTQIGNTTPYVLIEYE